MHRLLAVILALLVSALFGHAYHEKNREIKNAEGGLLSVSSTALFCLSDMGALKTMLESNASDELVRERVGRYAFCSLALSEASASLYDATGEKEYWDVHVAASNLAVFFNRARNSDDPRGLVARNVDVLLRVGREISRMYGAWAKGNVTEGMASDLLNLTETLSW